MKEKPTAMNELLTKSNNLCDTSEKTIDAIERPNKRDYLRDSSGKVPKFSREIFLQNSERHQNKTFFGKVFSFFF